MDFTSLLGSFGGLGGGGISTTDLSTASQSNPTTVNAGGASSSSTIVWVIIGAIAIVGLVFILKKK